MISLWVNACMYACVCVRTSPTQSNPPTHLHGLLQVLGRCTEAVEGEVFHNRVDPLTLRGQNHLQCTCQM